MRKNSKRKAMVLTAVFVMVFALSGMHAQAATKPTLNKTKITVTAGKAKKLKVNRSNGEKVKWMTKNTKVAVVSKTGQVKGKQAGTTVITAKVAGKKLKCKVTVKATINKKKIVLKEGNTYTLKVKGLGEGVIWISSNESIATVKKTEKNSAIVTGIKKGPCTITAVSRNGKYKMTCRISVKHAITKCELPETGTTEEKRTDALNHETNHTETGN